MVFDDFVASAVKKSLTLNIPFALYSFPGDKDVAFFANPSYPEVGDRRCLIVAPWLQPYAQSYRIADECDAVSIINLPDHILPAAIDYYIPTTNREAYLAGVSGVVERLVREGGKTVISSVISLDYTEIDAIAAAAEYFSIHPESFCYLYYTPETGLWLGASPEIIFSHDKTNGIFKTMAFAGTRAIENSGTPWDRKNIEEQRVVADYIAERLDHLNVKYVEKPTITVDYGNIQHLCTFFEGKVKASMTEMIVDSLNPTPALAGYPKATAIAEIAAVESHKRECYGGIVGIDDENSTKIYVNLRCARLSRRVARLYAGGGITAASIPEDEWDETRLKAKVLKSIIEKSAR